MFGSDLFRAISGFRWSGFEADPPTTGTSGTADCYITFSKKGGGTQETVTLDPIHNQKATEARLTDAVNRITLKDIHGKPSEYVRLSVTMKVLHIIYELGLLKKCGSSDNRIHIEISSTTDDLSVSPADGSNSTIDMVQDAMCKNIELILAITVAGYDVSGKDGVYHAALNSKTLQHEIREYRRMHNDTVSKNSNTDIEQAKNGLIAMIKSRIGNYLQDIVNPKSRKNISAH